MSDIQRSERNSEFVGIKIVIEILISDTYAS
jgi:hypothetical protein